jgi:hypothetical protein
MTITKSRGASRRRRLVNWLNEPASPRMNRASRVMAATSPVLAGALPVIIVLLMKHPH